MKNYDDAVSFLGQWGLFQMTVCLLLCATIMPNGFGGFTLVLLTDVPEHRCLIPGDNLTESWRQGAIPAQVVNGKQELSSCSRYKLDVVRNLSAQGLIPGIDVNLTDLEQESCVDGWNYSKKIYDSTLVTEFNLVCDDKWKQPFTTMIFYAGILSGSFFSGPLSDRFGRKPVLFATIATQMVFTFLQVFSTSWIMLLILLFINGLGQMSNFVAALVLGSETLIGNVRIIYASVGTMSAFALGYMILPILAYFLRDWKHLQLALSVPCLLYIPFWWLIPESPRWLLSQGKVEEAEAILKKAAKWNKVQAPSVIFEGYSPIKKKRNIKESFNFFLLLKHSHIRTSTIVLCFLWFTTSLGYYSLSFNTTQFHADPYIACFISAAVEVPAYICSWLVLQYLPRRHSIISILVVGALPLFFIQLVPKGQSQVSLTLETLGKFAVTTSFSMVFVYASEIYPTAIRNTATATSSTFARLGSCVTPFFLKLNDYHIYLPYIILGILYILCGFCTLLLPETFKQPLPETIEQMQKQTNRITCPCINRTKTTVPVTMSDDDS
ncbi:solute carrier family 22 member 4-like isoform X1 [Gouania willdenowi]|uniref:Solute carrier family 22 member 4-like n=1 Tax=Gouania willdenowi TaxID=441366 RepID=A0A8C5GG46_GOUWI|nr:solute carrier family 22 member 4-like isoform X1 [Gouania willdenowi]